jgi:hypothetical protein
VLVATTISAAAAMASDQLSPSNSSISCTTTCRLEHPDGTWAMLLMYDWVLPVTVA